MTPRMLRIFLVATIAMAAFAPAQQEPGRAPGGRQDGAKARGPQRKPVHAGTPDVNANSPQEKPGATKPRDSAGKPRISDLTNPMRARRAGKPAADGETSPESVLRLAPGLGGDALRGLSESEADLSPDVRLLIRFSRMPGSQARRRATIARTQRNSTFFRSNTRGAPTWAEREQRDGRGRITSMRDAAGNRTKFRYDEHGLVRMDAEPVGRHNPKLGDTAGTFRNPQRGGLGTPLVFDQRNFKFGPRHSVTLSTPATSKFTSSRFDNRTGGREFTTRNLRGQPAIRYDSTGKLTMRRYDSMGRLIGTYDAKGRLTILNHDERGRPNFGVDPFGNRAMLDPNRSGGTVLGTNKGEVYKGGGRYGQLKPGAPSASAPVRPAAPVPGATPKPKTGTPGGNVPSQLPPPYPPRGSKR